MALILFFASYAAWRVAVHNEAVVIPDTFYRSGQLSPSELQREISENKIRTVINLRGENESSPWYKQELAVCHAQGVQHVDVALSARHLPPPAEVDSLLDAFRNSPRPILVHCRSGSDRAGLVTGMFLIDQEQVPWKQAEDALTWRYGHFGVYPYFEMDKFIQLYGQSANPSLDDWARHDYPAIYAKEIRETKSQQMMEPLELLFRGRLD